jgi:hypothetical protein
MILLFLHNSTIENLGESICDLSPTSVWVRLSRTVKSLLPVRG